MSAGALALGLIHAAPAFLSLPSVDLPLCFRSSHFSVGAHPSGVVVPNASPVVQLGLPGLCHLSAAASGRAPPFRLSSFPYPRVPVLYDSIAAGPRQAAVATPVAGGCRFVPVGALVLGPYALPLSCDHAFGGSSVASRLFSFLVCARLSPRMSPCRLHHLPSGFDCPVFVVLSFCLGTCSLFLLSLLSYSTVLMLNTYIAIGPPQAAVATSESVSGGCRATSVGVLCSIFGELRLHC